MSKDFKKFHDLYVSLDVLLPFKDYPVFKYLFLYVILADKITYCYPSDTECVTHSEDECQELLKLIFPDLEVS